MQTLRPATRLVTAVGTAMLAAHAAGPVAAQEPGKLYAGVGLGVIDFDSAHAGIGYGETAVGLQLYGGLQAREGAAVELAVEHFARIQSDDILGSGLERLRISADTSAVTVRGVFSLSLQDVLRRRRAVTVFGTVGLARMLEQRDVLELTTSKATSVSERDTALVLGVGVTFDIARVRLRTYLQSADRSQGDLNSLGVGAEFRF